MIRYRIWLRSARRQPRTSRSALVQYANHSATEQPEYSSSQLAPPLREHTCHMESHSVACHPAEVTFLPLPQPKLVLDQATPEGCKALAASSGKHQCVGLVSVCPSVRLSVPSTEAAPLTDRRSISAVAKEQQRPASYIAIRGSTQTCIQSASARVSKGRYDTIPELSMGPFCVTRSNLTNQLTDLTQPTTSEKKLWTQPDPTQCN